MQPSQVVGKSPQYSHSDTTRPDNAQNDTDSQATSIHGSNTQNGVYADTQIWGDNPQNPGLSIVP